ncbi:MAB_1171c family putative transporter, partial [Nocardiopsis rhodophaea]
MSSYLVAAGISTAALAYKARHIARDPKNPAQWAICGVVAGLGTAVTLGSPEVYTAFNAAVGIPNLARIFVHLMAITAILSIQVFFLHVADPKTARRKARIRYAVFATAAATMVATFWATPLPIDEPTRFVERYATTELFVVYMAAYLGFAAWAMLDLIPLTNSYARNSDRPLLRSGIRLISAGCAFALLYSCNKFYGTLGFRYGWDIPSSNESLSRLLTAACVSCVAVGVALPSATRLAAIATWPRRLRLYRRLHPLWLELYRADPRIALNAP